VAEPRLTDPWTLAGMIVPNRVVLAPLAGIGNWFVRLQAKRYGAGMTVSEMVSSHAIHHGNERTCTEMLRIHPAEREHAGPIAIQLFGQDPEIMRSAAARVAEAGADVVDLNMGCPVPKVMKTGAGVALLRDHDLAVEVALAAHEGSGLPVTVKLRSGIKDGGTEGLDLARRLASDAGVAAIGFHPRSAQVHHKGAPNLELARELVADLPVPVVLSGGMRDPAWVVDAWRTTGAEAVMLARGALGNPWLFARLAGRADGEPGPDEILRELHWVIDRAVEHLGEPRAGRYLRKFYPWYVERLGRDKRLQEALLRTASADEARAILHGVRTPAAA
jgi:tRNA-dihydrouridine synthase B